MQQSDVLHGPIERSLLTRAELLFNLCYEISNWYCSRKLVKNKSLLVGKPLGTVCSGDDPIQIVTRSWPWKDLDGGFSQSLRPLFKHSLHTNNDNDAPADDNIFNKDPLVSLKFQFSQIISLFSWMFWIIFKFSWANSALTLTE